MSSPTPAPVRVRFAPSPTGPLHIGGVRTALYNYYLARQTGGTLILRIEDTDQNRFVPSAEAYIIEALTWVGIRFDEGPHVGGPHGPYRQSERKPIYRQFADDLVANGWAYYAFDTEADLDAMRERAKAGGMAFSYNYATRDHLMNSLTLPHDEVQRRLAAEEPYVIRFKIPRKEEVRFEDHIRGWVVVATKDLDDKVLLKNDGMPTYHLANIVDDRLMGITHVVRGEEWLPSTPLHVLMYRAFGWEAPQFAHLPLLLKPGGQGKLSKRDGDALGFPVFPLEWRNPDTGEVSSGYREEGYAPEALVNFLSLLGWHPSGDVSEIMSVDDLVRDFSLDRVNKAGAKFDKSKLEFFNQHYLRQQPADAFLPLLKALPGAEGLSDDQLLAMLALVRDRLVRLKDLPKAAELFLDPSATHYAQFRDKMWTPALAPALADLRTALATVQDWSHDGLQSAIKAFCAEQNVKMGKLMPMLRLAATGTGEGPGVLDILAWLGPTATLKRLEAGLAELEKQH